VPIRTTSYVAKFRIGDDRAKIMPEGLLVPLRRSVLEAPFTPLIGYLGDGNSTKRFENSDLVDERPG
jgi:hypothetical protein